MKKLLALLLIIPTLSFAQFGVLDNNFDADGIVEIDNGGFSSRGHDVVIQPDGKILVCGWATSGNEPYMFVNRMWPDGSPDNDFGVMGQSTLAINGNPVQCYAIALQDDGDIIIVGGAFNIDIGSILIRLKASDGLPDPSFGTNGYIILPDINASPLYDVAIQEDGKIVAAGITTGPQSVKVVRLNLDGTYDNTFSFNGLVFTNIGELGDFDWAQGVAIESNGKITIAGSIDHGGGNVNSILIRYNSDGSLDDSFGINGIVEESLSNTVDKFYNLTIDASGSIYACGFVQDGDYNMAVAKFNSNGMLDNSFSFDGAVEFDIDGGEDRAWDILLQPDGKILIAGVGEFQGDDMLAMIRLQLDGTLDNTFGNSGVALTSNGIDDEWHAVALQDDLKIVAAGYTNNGGTKAIVARYTSGMNVGIGDVDAYIGSTLIYPNPISEQLTVEYELKSSQKVAIELLDMSGKRVALLQPETEVLAGEQVKSFNLPQLESGNYLLQLRTEKGNVGVKLTVN